jgi:hypothetical protein
MHITVRRLCGEATNFPKSPNLKPVRTNRLLRKHNSLGQINPTQHEFLRVQDFDPTPAGAGKAIDSMIHHQRFPPPFRQHNTQVVLANRAPGAEGKPTKGHSRLHILSNRPTSGTFTKNRGLRTIPNPTNAQGGLHLPAKNF